MTETGETFAIEIVRRFAAAPEKVFSQWLDADALKDWFVPAGHTGLSATCDPVQGGRWSVSFADAEGRRYEESGILESIAAPHRLVLTLDHTSEFSFHTRIEVAFDPDGEDGTRMRFRQSGFTSARQRDSVAQGWQTCLDTLALRLGGAEAEIAALFTAWFDASTRKDLDASMAPIGADIVSYEHSGPLEVTDIAVMRAECESGFDRASDDFRWDIPDLKVIVRGDIAVTWGLNRMADHAKSDDPVSMWSRGTRIFQRRPGGWTLIHQHVSFPMDAATGRARTDLVP